MYRSVVPLSVPSCSAIERFWSYISQIVSLFHHKTYLHNETHPIFHHFCAFPSKIYWFLQPWILQRLEWQIWNCSKQFRLSERLLRQNTLRQLAQHERATLGVYRTRACDQATDNFEEKNCLPDAHASLYLQLKIYLNIYKNKTPKNQKLIHY